MRFDLVDAVVEIGQDRIVTLKHVTAAEEYLQDHFPTFPVLPGVLMVEAMVQAARRLLAERDPGARRLVLGGVRALKYGAMVRPGQTLRLDVSLVKNLGEGAFEFKGAGTVLSPGGRAGDAPVGEPPTAVSGRFTLRPLRFGRAQE